MTIQKAQGYCRFPTLHGETIAFVCEDDLWSVSASGGVARRLTANLSEVSHPRLSPDGKLLAFTGREEGPPEVYVMPATGGTGRRLTFLGAATEIAEWSRDGRSIIFTSDAGQPFARMMKLFEVDAAGGLPRLLPYGAARSLCHGRRGAVVLGRNTTDPARWKRYRGGTAGTLWIDRSGTGKFKPLIQIDGNLASPMWVGDRVYFLSDHEGSGNLYSCLPSGKGLRRHTDHEDYYARHATTDGGRIVYQAGAQLYLFDPENGKSVSVPVELHSPRTQRNRKFVDSEEFLEEYAPHPRGHSLALTIRGKVFTTGNFEGPVVQHGVPDGVRYRLAAWLPDGKRLLMVNDESGEDELVIHDAAGEGRPVRLTGLEIGRPVEMAVSPAHDLAVLVNHRAELLLVDLKKRKARVVETSRHGRIEDLAWSPDGLWVAYSMPIAQKSSILKLLNVKRRTTHPITTPVLRDVAPSFDPDGRYLYFISYREFDPVYDSLNFDLNFPLGMRPYLITLRRDLPSPFLPQPGHDSGGGREGDPGPPPDEKKQARQRRRPIRIDLAGIENRILAFPVPEGRYEQIRGLPGGKVLFSAYPAEGALPDERPPEEDCEPGVLDMYDLHEQKREYIIGNVSDFAVSGDYKSLFYRSDARLRVIPAGERPKDDLVDDPPGRRSGWIDLDRVKVSVDSAAEWEQMFIEAWRLQRDHFWDEHMAGVDWKNVFERYFPLLARVTTRSEFSDLMWEMQGELGTSHAYELGGDYRKGPRYHQGFLAARFAWDRARRGYRIEEIGRGDPWASGKDSPLNAPGLNLRPGDVLLAIGGRRLSPQVTPHELLVNQAGAEIQVAAIARGRRRSFAVKALADEKHVWYRDWVERNRQLVHKISRGRVGYVHIPDMGPRGYAEFHRYYLAENRREGLLVDVRFNAGGHVSELILEKLMRRRIGYDVQRWGEPEPYPLDSVLGPKVCLTNEWAGSDGDIFSHCFKLLGLGPLIGKRTWGGVVGIWPRHALVDGSVTTQPEFSFWFRDVGWGVENHGTEPDIEVELSPQDDAMRNDTQLLRAIDEVLKALKANPPDKPPANGH